jgi:hypothetical protein
MADEALEGVAAVRPWRRQVFAEQRVGDEA